MYLPIQSIAHNQLKKMGLVGKLSIKIVATVILLPLFYKAQNTVYTEIYNFNTKVLPSNLSPDKAIISYNEGFIYAVAQNDGFATDVTKIKQYNTKTKE